MFSFHNARMDAYTWPRRKEHGPPACVTDILRRGGSTAPLPDTNLVRLYQLPLPFLRRGQRASDPNTEPNRAANDDTGTGHTS